MNSFNLKDQQYIKDIIQLIDQQLKDKLNPICDCPDTFSEFRTEATLKSYQKGKSNNKISSIFENLRLKITTKSAMLF